MSIGCLARLPTITLTAEESADPKIGLVVATRNPVEIARALNEAIAEATGANRPALMAAP